MPAHRRRACSPRSRAARGWPPSSPSGPTPGDTVVINGKTVHLATRDAGWKLLAAPR
jgi:hypothetical protein